MIGALSRDSMIGGDPVGRNNPRANYLQRRSSNHESNVTTFREHMMDPSSASFSGFTMPDRVSLHPIFILVQGHFPREKGLDTG